MENDDFYFKCSQCGKIYPIEKGRYLCDDCIKKQEDGKPLNGVLLVEFADNFIKKFNERPEEFIEITENNKNDFVVLSAAPFLPSYNLKEYLEEIPVGNTPLIRSNKLENELNIKELYLKWEGSNLSGSYKDRASILVSAMAKQFGENNIVVASTGNAASSMAAIGAAMKQNIFIFAPKTAPIGKLAQILQYGAKLFLIDGNYDDAFNLSMKFSSKTGFLSRNTGFNPFTIEGKKTSSYELLIKNKSLKGSVRKDSIDSYLPLDLPDYILVPVGDGVIISGLIEGFLNLLKLKIIERLPVVVGVQAQGSSYIANAFESSVFPSNYNSNTLADSISVNSPRCGYLAIELVKKTGGFFIKVSDESILEAQHLLAKNTGIFAEPSSCTTIAAVIKESRIFSSKKTVALITGHGLKDIDNALKIIKQPKPIDNDFESVMKYFEKIKN